MDGENNADSLSNARWDCALGQLCGSLFVHQTNDISHRNIISALEETRQALLHVHDCVGHPPTLHSLDGTRSF